MSTGEYARKQIHCKALIIAWSHRSRFAMARKLVKPWAGRPLMDYGCGDGTFLQSVSDLFPTGYGVDISADHVNDCNDRLAKPGGLSFQLIPEIPSSAVGQYGVVTCMEVLEHCLVDVQKRVLDDLRRYCSPDGKVIISVPIEIGPTILGKYVLRTIAGWRGLSDYRHYERYSIDEMFSSLFATSKSKLNRPAYGEGDEAWHSHKGFNWRQLRVMIAEKFVIEQTRFTPLGVPGGMMASQVWFVCRPRATSN